MAISLTHEIEIGAPAALAWDVVADYSRDVEWRDGVVSMVPTPIGSVRVGTTTAEIMKVAGRTYRNAGEVVTVEPATRFAWRTTSGAVAHGARQVAPIDAARCRVRLELHVTPSGINRLLAPVLRAVLARALTRDLERLRGLLEDDTPMERSVGGGRAGDDVRGIAAHVAR